MKKQFFLQIFLLFLSVTLFAQVPNGYYAPAEGKTNAELKTALHQIIEKGTRLGYGSGSGKTWSGFEKTDLHPDGHVWDMYSSNKVKFPGGGGVASGMNIEHSVAKSWWGGTNNDAYKDLYHLNPSNTQANSARGSYPLGINSGGKWSNGVIKVGNNTYSVEYSGLCFEPLDEYKGDFARAYLYMFTCYEDFSWTGTSAPTMLTASETWPMLKTWAKNMLLEWHRKDPVSDKELKRSAEIFKIQSNRNPYIDYPELVEHLWGNKVGQPWNAQGGDFPYISAPVYGQEIDFGKVVYGNNRTSTLHVKASNLTGDLTLSLTGANAADFGISTQTIEKIQAESGFDVTITYNATSVGARTAVLNIAGGGITSISVPVKALSSDEFMALPASNVSHSGFTANWTVSATAQNYSLDVFTLESDGSTQPAVLLEESFDNGMPAFWDAGGYTDTNTKGSVRLGSGSSNGSISTPPMDLSASGTVLSVKAKRYGSDSNADITVSIDNGEVTKWTTESNSKEFSITLNAFSDASVITFSAFKDRRVYIESVKLEIPAEVYRPVSVAGFPVSVGNILNYTITGLHSDSSYYYTVSPQNNSNLKTDPIAVRTLLTSALPNSEGNRIGWSSVSNGIRLHELPFNCTITVTDIAGKRLTVFSTNDTSATINLSKKGIYFIGVQTSVTQNCLKVIF